MERGFFAGYAVQSEWCCPWQGETCRRIKCRIWETEELHFSARGPPIWSPKACLPSCKATSGYFVIFFQILIYYLSPSWDQCFFFSSHFILCRGINLLCNAFVRRHFMSLFLLFTSCMTSFTIENYPIQTSITSCLPLVWLDVTLYKLLCCHRAWTILIRLWQGSQATRGFWRKCSWKGLFWGRSKSWDVISQAAERGMCFYCRLSYVEDNLSWWIFVLISIFVVL